MDTQKSSYIAVSIIVAAVLLAFSNRYQISSNRYINQFDNSEGSIVYRLDKFTGEICMRMTQSTVWTCYLLKDERN